MSTSSVEFPLSPLTSKKWIVAEPIIPLAIMTPEGFKFYDFLVDSGADFTLLPRHFASEIGINLKNCEKSTTMGVEGRGMIIYHASILLKIGSYQSKIRCAFAHHDKIPPLLGRLDVFSLYNITFHAERRSIIFQKVRTTPLVRKLSTLNAPVGTPEEMEAEILRGRLES